MTGTDMITYLQIPIGIESYDDGIVLFSVEQTDDIIGNLGIVIQEDTLNKAKAQALDILKYHIKYLEKRSNELDLWKPFQKGQWSHIGGTWFTVFGIHVYFRYGDGMKGGWYIPFTRLNITVNNYWKRKY